MAPFMTIEKRPRVIKTTGDRISFRIGRMVLFRAVKIRASTASWMSVPEKVKAGRKRLKPKITAALPAVWMSSLKIRCIWLIYMIWFKRFSPVISGGGDNSIRARIVGAISDMMPIVGSPAGGKTRGLCQTLFTT